jgi:hypothetical protein
MEFKGPPESHSCPDPIELILYVSAASPHSEQTIACITRVLERLDRSRVTLTVCDLTQDRQTSVEDRITRGPTPVRRAPGPRTFILGHIGNRQLLLDLLADCDGGGEAI